MQKDAILSEILRVYGSQRACAEKLGISEQTFSHNLNKLSPRFIARLKTIGIILPDKQEKNISINESELQNLVSKLVKENFELKEENAKLKILVDTHCKKPNRSFVK